MTISGETVYCTGLVLTGLTALITVIAVPVFLLTGRKLKKQLELEYGKTSRRTIRKG